MAHRRLVLVLAQIVVFACLAPGALADINPVLTAAVSRQSHGGTNFDIPLPLVPSGSGTGIECRRVNGTVNLRLTFDQPVTGGTVAVAAGAATAGTPVFNNTNLMTVQLTGATDLQEITLTVSNVTSAAGGSLASASVNIRMLEGDVDGSGTVSVADVNKAKLQAGVICSGFNFRSDLNQNAALTASDVNLIKARSGKSVAGGAMLNTAPTIGTIADQTSNTGVATVEFAVGDAELAPDMLAVTAVSTDNQTLLPNGSASFQFGGTGATRTLAITSAVNQVGTAHVKVTVGDGLTTSSSTFLLTVSATPKLYLGVFKPVILPPNTSGSGYSTLLMDGDETAATVRVNYSNLSSAKNGMVIHTDASLGSTTLFTLTSGTLQADGSYRWVFAPAGSLTVADIVNAIKGGHAYIDIDTANNTGGELTGQYLAATGSMTFSPPPAPGGLPGGLPTAQDAARFLTQATFGPTSADIANVQSIGFDAWLANQFSQPPTSIYTAVYNRCTTSSSSADALSSERIVESWWKNVIIAPDQLRQRVATALSEIFVVSNEAEAIAAQSPGLATYYDMLAADAFGNYRTILGDVTKHPIMGQYLNMRGNKKQATLTSPVPNENYAREINQLFSIGLVQLQLDGTLKLDISGQPIPTYDQNVIMGFAQVFTGWDTDPVPVAIPTSQPSGPPVNFNSSYNKPMKVVSNGVNHSTTSKLLLNGQTIAATGSASEASTIAELDTALNNIFNHPNVGPFICRELIQRLVCANPSPGYVYRVAQVFSNDGSGTRGNMQAVIKAILTDYEARSTDVLGQQGYGHLREPLLRMSHLIRAFHPTSTSGIYKISSTPELNQTIFDATTVFNFFEPYYSFPGELTANGLLTPEFEIASETSNINTHNTFYTGIYSGWKNADVKNDYTTEVNVLSSGSADPVADLLDELNGLLMSGQMPSAMKDRIVTFVKTLPNSTTTDKTNRAKAAIHLVGTSAQFSVQR